MAKKNPLTEDQYLKIWQESEATIDKLSEYENEIKIIQQKMNEVYQIQKLYIINYHIPQLYINEVHPKKTSNQSKSASIDYPHLRAVGRYDYLGKIQRFSIFIGRLEDFEGGKNNPKAIDIAKKKSVKYLKKKHPELFVN